MIFFQAATSPFLEPNYCKSKWEKDSGDNSPDPPGFKPFNPTLEYFGS